MALIQMQNLGTMLPTNGPYAEKAKTLLQRCSDKRLNHLGIAIGWRKNDSASLMAESAGGQAAALLSMCLGNLFRPTIYGQILSHLCSTLLEKSMQVSSMSQLADAAKLLAAKLNTLGFGNLFACEITKIYRVYESLDEAAPKNLLESLSVESATELLKGISRALCEDEMICRISGVQGMGQILGLLQVLCPRSTAVTVEGVLIQDTQDRKIIVEFQKEYENGPVNIYLETKIWMSTHLKLPIVRSETVEFVSGHSGDYHFQWSGWLADWLQLTFLRHGLSCDQDILDACCDLLWFELELIHLVPRDTAEESAKVPPVSLPALLDLYHSPRVFEVCNAIWRAIPKLQSRNWDDSFNRLVKVVRLATQSQACTCELAPKCDLSTGWSKRWHGNEDHLLRSRRSHCAIYNIWYSIRKALVNGLCALFIEPGQNAIASISLYHRGVDSTISTGIFGSPSLRHVESTNLYSEIMQMAEKQHTVHGIASSHGSSTIYPAVLETMSVPTSQSVIFKLVDGQIMFAGHYHRIVIADNAPPPSTRTASVDNGRCPTISYWSRAKFSYGKYSRGLLSSHSAL